MTLDGSDKTDPDNLDRPLPDLSTAVQSLSDAAVPLLGKTCEMLGQFQAGWLFQLLTVKNSVEGVKMVSNYSEALSALESLILESLIKEYGK